MKKVHAMQRVALWRVLGPATPVFTNRIQGLLVADPSWRYLLNWISCKVGPWNECRLYYTADADVADRRAARYRECSEE